MSTNLPSYGSIRTLGHPEIADLLDGYVEITEKVDGSMFGFGYIDGELRFRSKGREILPETVDKLFAPAVTDILRGNKHLLGQWWYWGETLAKPKHNTLQYEHVPISHVALFDVQVGPEMFLSYEHRQKLAVHLALDYVPTLYAGPGQDISQDALEKMLEQGSFLGGTQIEGVVIKSFSQFNPKTGKPLRGKYVSEKFKEAHTKDWKNRHPGKQEITQELIERYATEARWAKAVQHLRDDGLLQGTPQDIGPLIKHVQEDWKDEAEAEVKELLWQHYRDKVKRGVTGGFAEWYKSQLLERQFDDA